MKLARVIRRLAQMPPSRRWQWAALKRDRLITSTLYAARLRRCGVASIVQKPLFWTPEFIEVGDGVLIWPGCRIEGLNEYGGVPYAPIIRIESGVSLQQYCHVVAATELVIGQDTTISSGVFITDSDHGHEAVGVNVLEQPLLIRQTRIGRSCFIGVGARILAGTRLGDHCVVAANAVVRGVFPAHCIIAGSPGRIVKRFDADAGCWRKTNAEGLFLP